MKSTTSKIELLQGDLTEMDVDAIVNAANNDLQLGGGVAGAIRRKGGPAIQEECDRIGSIPLGTAAITGGGNMKARHVIHAASMRLGGVTTPESLRSSTAHCLRLAAHNGLKSIAFPAVGTGIAGFPMRTCAEIMLSEAVRHLQGATSIDKIYFVLFDGDALRVFEEVWREMNLSGKESGPPAVSARTRVLFVCTGNMARSQMAEGLARSMAAPDVEVASAGTHPNPKGIHPLAIEMLREKGIDPSGQRPKHVDELPGEFDFVITLCDSAAQECPMLPARRARMHWGLTDPAAAGSDPQRQRALFREIRDEIERRLREWLGGEGLLREAK